MRGLAALAAAHGRHAGGSNVGPAAALFKAQMEFNKMNKMRTTAGYVYVGAAGPSSAERLSCIAAAGAEYCGTALCAGATRELSSGRAGPPAERAPSCSLNLKLFLWEKVFSILGGLCGRGYMRVR